MCELLLNSFQYMCLKKNYLQEIEKKYLYTFHLATVKNPPYRTIANLNLIIYVVNFKYQLNKNFSL